MPAELLEQRQSEFAAPSSPCASPGDGGRRARCRNSSSSPFKSRTSGPGPTNSSGCTAARPRRCGSARRRSAAGVCSSRSVTCQSIRARTTVGWNWSGPSGSCRCRTRSTARRQNSTSSRSSSVIRSDAEGVVDVVGVVGEAVGGVDDLGFQQRLTRRRETAHFRRIAVACCAWAWASSTSQERFSPGKSA